MAGAKFRRGMMAIIKTTFGFIWLGWGLDALVRLPAAIFRIEPPNDQSGYIRFIKHYFEMFAGKS